MISDFMILRIHIFRGKSITFIPAAYFGADGGPMKNKCFLLCAALAAALFLAAAVCGCGDSGSVSVNSSESGGAEGPSTAGGGGTVVDLSNARYLVLKNDGTATLDGQDITAYDDYIWHADTSAVHAVGDIVDGKAVTAVVKNSPAEYYTGTAPSGNEGVYISRDII